MTDIIKTLVGMIEPKTELDNDIKRAALALIEKEMGEQPAPKKIKSTAPAAKPKKRKPFDTGKMKALLDGGWSIPKIADEMGVTQSTIYNHMKSEGIVLGS